MTIAVVTDSTSSLTPSRAGAAHITVVPIQVNVGAETFIDGPDVTADRIASALRDFVPVNTSRPNPAVFAETYAKLAEQGASEIISVHLSAHLSGTFDSAVLAAKDSPVPVHVVDTEQVGIATGFISLDIARALTEGAGVREAVAAAQWTADQAVTFFYVDTLEYLRRGGRVSSAAALVGSALAVKPLLSVDHGFIKPVEKVRTSSKALSRLHDLVVQRVIDLGVPCDIGVQHLDSRTVATTFAAKLGQSLSREEIEVSEVGAAIAAHVGPGMISVAVVPQLEF